MPATTVGNFFVDEYLRDPSYYGQELLYNPGSEDPFTNPAVRERIYNALQSSGKLKPSLDALTAPTSTWTSNGTAYNSALSIPDAPDRDEGIGEWAKIVGMFAGMPAAAGLVSGALGGGGSWLSNLFSGAGMGGEPFIGGMDALAGGLSDAAMVGESLGSVGGSPLSEMFSSLQGMGKFTQLPMGAFDESFGGLAGDELTSLYKELGISPTTSIPGIGDIYGSGAGILKNLFSGGFGGGGVGGSLLSKLFSGAGGANSGQYSFPFADVLKGVMEYGGQKDYQSELLRLMDKSIEYSDPFRSQRSRYFEPLYDAATKGVGGTPYGESIANATMRKLSSTGDAGYDISGLGANTLAKNLNSASMDYVKTISPLAGAQFGGNASQSITSMGPAAAGAGLAAQGGLGAAFEAVNRGSQPSSLEQLFGKQKNQNLGQALFSF